MVGPGGSIAIEMRFKLHKHAKGGRLFVAGQSRAVEGAISHCHQVMKALQVPTASNASVNQIAIAVVPQNDVRHEAHRIRNGATSDF